MLAQRAGLTDGVLSARHSGATTERAAQLRIPIVRQGSADKLETLEEIIAAEGISADEVAFMGDDLLDLPVIERVGLAPPRRMPPPKYAAARTGSPRAGAATAPSAS